MGAGRHATTPPSEGRWDWKGEKTHPASIYPWEVKTKGPLWPGGHNATPNLISRPPELSYENTREPPPEFGFGRSTGKSGLPGQAVRDSQQIVTSAPPPSWGRHAFVRLHATKKRADPSDFMTDPRRLVSVNVRRGGAGRVTPVKPVLKKQGGPRR